MTKKNVGNEKKESSQLDYSDLPDELTKVIEEPLTDVTEKEMNIVFDGKQFLVRFPKDIANAIGVKKGDKIKFKVTSPSPKINQEQTIEIEYLKRGEDGE
jgi:hypothetical protein